MFGAAFSWRELLQAVRKILEAGTSPEARVSAEAESERIVAAAAENVTGAALARHELFMHSADPVDIQISGRALRWAQERSGGRPLQYILGYQDFLDHRYAVEPGVLIPRPETEVLVRAVLERLPKDFRGRGLEIGIGSGAIAIELLTARPGLTMVATELSPVARAVAAKSARGILGVSGAARLEIVPVADAAVVLEPVADLGPFDFMVCNPPYLLPEAGETTAEVAKHEPREALYAPEGDPLHFYRRIAHGAGRLLNPDGFAAVEIPHERAMEIEGLFAGGKANLISDLSGRPRVLICVQPN